MKILFVDDEPKMLEALERSLMAIVDDDVELDFAGSGAEALHRLASAEYDVVVTDMQMPGMDGGTLLEEVYRQQPGAVRLVLSGHVKSEAIFQSAKYAHQFLCKPSSAESIIALIHASVQMRELLDQPMFCRAVARVDALPPLPATYQALSAALARDDVSAKLITGIVERDAALAAKTMQIANSAFFAGGRKFTELAAAVGRLGFDVIKGLALSGAFQAAAIPRTPAVDIDRIAARSLEVAAMARALAGKMGDAAFTAGVLRDCGVLVLAANVPDELERVWTDAKARKLEGARAELEAWGTDHAKIGAYLLALWGLPASLVDAVAKHHDSTTQAGWSIEAAAVRVASDLIDGVASRLDLLTMLGGETRLREVTARLAA